MLRKIFQGILITVAFLLLSATILSMLPLNQWWSRVFDFPRIQIVALALLVLLLYSIFFQFKPKINWSIYGLMIGVIVYQSIQIYPYTFLANTQTSVAQNPDTANCIKMLISNVLMKNHRSEALLQLVEDKKPDLVLLMEPDQWWQQQMKPLEEEYEYTVLHPLDNTYGMLLYSHFPLQQTEIHNLLQDSIPSIHTYVTLPSGQLVKLYCVHPEPPVPGHSATSTERDAELLLVGKMIEKKKEPAILTGDLNDVAWSPTSFLFRKISQMLDPRVGRGFYNTFNANYSLLRWPIDHVFHTEHFQLVDLEVLPAIGSDHFPFYFTLSFQPGKEWQQNEPEAPSPEEEEKAEDTIEKGLKEGDGELRK
uniref:Endonuclease/exonuclease/phosphatase family protein n=1 Tax=Roseihalotalea indica TaxID=2867963 RepID=A0AA49JFQ5_9BACT|nr:endonuclease/exonuclease/phosphatase family protein [Tunicatimonas sp. TK19036]